MMSSSYTPERRQAPRLALDGAMECRLDLRTRVRLMDISLGGALLAAEVALPTGASAQLRSGLGQGALHANVQVRRTAALQPGISVTGIGAMFTGMDDRSRRSLEDFLRKASQ
jgi:c-di-GMP-binding flagellar brake protein YcgR